MIPGAVHRSPDIYLTAEENPGKPQLGDRLIQMRSVGSHNTSGRQKEENKEGDLIWVYQTVRRLRSHHNWTALDCGTESPSPFFQTFKCIWQKRMYYIWQHSREDNYVANRLGSSGSD